MAASSAVLLERYLHTSYRPDREFIDNRIIERNVGEFPHSRMMALLGARLHGFEKQCGMVALVT